MSWRRLLGCGLVAAALAGLAGGALERWWFGPTDASAASRVEARVRHEFDQMIAALDEVAASIANDPGAVKGLATGPEGARGLFAFLANLRARSPHPDDVAVTVYDEVGQARAWSGRASDIPRERTGAGQDLFVQRSALGLRLVYVRPLAGTDSRRIGTIAAEHVLSRAAAGAALAASDDSFPTAIAPVALRPRSEGGGDRARPGTFVLRTPSNQTLVEASISPADLQNARTAWRRTIVAWVIVILGVTTLLLVGPLLDARARWRDGRAFLLTTVSASLLLVCGAAAIWAGLMWSTHGRQGLGVNLTFVGAVLAALAALWAAPSTQVQFAWRTKRYAFPGESVRFVLMHLLAGIAVAVCLFSFARVAVIAVDPAAVDVRHFSLYPWNAVRVSRLFGVLALHTAVLWFATLALIAVRGRWRLPKNAPGARLALLALWIAPTAAAATLAAYAAGWTIPAFAVVTSAAACAIAALLARRVATWYRHATVASRIFALFLSFLVPAILLYPQHDFFAERAIQRLISAQYAVDAQNYATDLQKQLATARAEIDAFAGLPDLVGDTDSGGAVRADADRALVVWRQTVLARNRLTSAVELYDRSGELVSRFALYLPEYTGGGQQPQAMPPCAWDTFAEQLPLGSEERSLLHAERGICTTDPLTGQTVTVGTIIVHVALDFRTLPFITSASPYFELFRPSPDGAPRGVGAGNDLHVAIYGWGLVPLYTSGLSAWPINEAVFNRLYDPERTPFWQTIPLGDKFYRVYFTNDRWGIYAIGYSLSTLFDHLVHLAEVTTLAGAAFVVVLFGTAVFTRLSRERPRVGRALLREIRSSFYRKLFLAFVAASIIPVLILALVIRAYFADLLRNDIQAEAARTAIVAKRVIEESDALLRRGAEGVGALNDNMMVWIRQVIDQDVNIFGGPELTATSERDLFKSGLLPTRTPDDVYRAIALEKLPSFVDEDQIGTMPYLIAATPARAEGQDFILTVPLAARQQEIERQKHELDRGVHLAVLCFILLGAALGLSLAERIADPVRRLTRATQRISRGDFDARIAVRSMDELRRLVDAFNSMAGELKSQRAELERTHRLEAWAEMARQVAHEIKNPLTPIQLSAEHLLRVHEDHRKPLGPILEGCVQTILGQVRLLRQIAAEFSSFASSPTVKATKVGVPELLKEILDPYRPGLTGRIEIRNLVSGPLPPVLADRALTLRALANVVENALHAMPGPGELVVDASADQTTMTITFKDSGVGMDEEALARVFEPYFSTKTAGTGLGLPIARRNIELNNGTIEVESKKGAGTTVTVRLPLG